MSDVVSRGTAPAAVTATAAQRCFGDRLPIAQRYVALLRSVGIERGLLGPREADRIWDRHVLNCAVVAPVPATGASITDVGSGAGLPGLVWAIARPDLEVRLVEPLARRSTFLLEAAEHLGLANVAVLRARAEDVEPESTDVVTARAVAPLERLATWCLPLLRPGGTLLALKGERASLELAAAAPVLRRLGAQSWSLQEYGGDLLEEATRVVRVRRGQQGVPLRRHRPGRRRPAG